MRFIPITHIKPGMLLAKSIYNKNGSLLLRAGTRLKSQYLIKMNEIGILGAYIEDEISKGLEIDSVISDELRMKTVDKVKDVFLDAEMGRPTVSQNMSQANELVDNMIDELIDNKHIVVNMIDIKSYDEYTYQHSVNVCVLSIIMGISLDFTREQLTNLGMSALLHDIGKIFIDIELLNKVEPLTEAEMDIMKDHSIDGYRYIKYEFDFPFQTNIGILQHHEKYDGTGYPRNKEGEDISLFARIIAIADVYDALISNRYYKKAVPPSEAMEYIMGGAGAHFDYDLVNIFVRKVALYPIGAGVKLSNGDVGIVAKNYSDAPNRPKIRLLDKDCKEYTYIDLKNDFTTKDITVLKIVNI